MPEQRDISIAEVLEAARRAIELGLQVALPAIVTKYDAVTKCADVQPAVKRPLEASDGSPVFERLEVIPNVKVAWLAGGGFELHFPLEVGDTVQLVFNDWDTSVWEETGEVSDPRWLELHGLHSPIAFPYARTGSNAQGANMATPSPFVFGSPGSAEFVALANLVGAQLADLKSAISGWTPAPNDGGAALKVALSAWLSSSSDVACTKLKAE